MRHPRLPRRGYGAARSSNPRTTELSNRRTLEPSNHSDRFQRDVAERPPPFQPWATGATWETVIQAVHDVTGGPRLVAHSPAKATVQGERGHEVPVESVRCLSACQDGDRAKLPSVTATRMPTRSPWASAVCLAAHATSVCRWHRGCDMHPHVEAAWLLCGRESPGVRFDRRPRHLRTPQHADLTAPRASSSPEPR